MAFKQADEKKSSAAAPAPAKSAATPSEKASKPVVRPKVAASERLGSLDAYRGLTML